MYTMCIYMYAHAHAARQTWWDQRVSRVDARSASAPESAPARSATYQTHHVANHMVRCPLLHLCYKSHIVVDIIQISSQRKPVIRWIQLHIQWAPYLDGG